MIVLPKLYAICDSAWLAGSAELMEFARQLVTGGCQLLQYRNKGTVTRLMLEQAHEVRRQLGDGVKLILNDRADLAVAAEFDGVHVGQGDLSPESARMVIGPEIWLGVSTHTSQQVAEANRTSADYIAIGPVFTTATKANPDPVVGLEGVRRARALTQKPLVAIGGITRVNCRSVIEAGADSVAVISDLLREPRKSAEEFFRTLR